MSCYNLSDEVTWRDVDEEMIVLHLPTGKYYTFNNTGHLVWQQLAEGKDTSEITSQIMDKYEVDRETAIRDLSAFISGLKEHNLISEKN
ncbi:MAG: PqqD family protein [Desulfobulbaceae bacterium]|nr:PqqD family protein [Desulfobulbaceae bacterium]